MPQPLAIVLEYARDILKGALHRVISDTALPAYLIEGILLDLLVDVKSQKATELAALYDKALEKATQQNRTDQPEREDNNE